MPKVEHKMRRWEFKILTRDGCETITYSAIDPANEAEKMVCRGARIAIDTLIAPSYIRKIVWKKV